MVFNGSCASAGVSRSPLTATKGKMTFMVIVRATRKLLQRLEPAMPDDRISTTALLGDWYATYLPWRPRQVALLVNERTLLPLLMPLAPAATFLDRFPDELAALLEAHHIPASVIAAEVAATRNARLATTANRSLLGSMNEFAFLAETHRTKGADLDLLELSLTLSRTPCSPLYSRHVSPDREVAALLGVPTA